jgi:hypothetical protein
MKSQFKNEVPPADRSDAGRRGVQNTMAGSF